MSTPEELSHVEDELLVRRMAAGDTAAFASFYDRHSTLLYSLALKILQNETEAADVLQDACVQLWEKAGAYQPSLGRPISWAVTIVRSRAIDRIRSTQRRSRILAGAIPDLPLPSAPGPEPAARLERVESAVRVQGALGGLPPAQREAIEMAFFQGMTQAEIAGSLGEPLGTVKARMRRGMLLLRDALEGDL